MAEKDTSLKLIWVRWHCKGKTGLRRFPDAYSQLAGCLERRNLMMFAH